MAMKLQKTQTQIDSEQRRNKLKHLLYDVLKQNEELIDSMTAFEIVQVFNDIGNAVLTVEIAQANDPDREADIETSPN
jgi:hypothetical protein